MQSESKKSKKSYHKPQLSVYGSVETFTLAANNTVNANADGGAAPTQKTR